MGKWIAGIGFIALVAGWYYVTNIFIPDVFEHGKIIAVVPQK